MSLKYGCHYENSPPVPITFIPILSNSFIPIPTVIPWDLWELIDCHSIADL